MIRHVACLLILICTMPSVRVLADTPKLPSPPDGFDWQWCDDVRVGLLRPNKWHFKTEKKGETLAYFVTKEKIDGNKGFSTGLTLNVIPHVGKKNGGSASDYARRFVREAIQDKKTVLEVLPPKKAGPANTFGCRIKKDGSTTHYFLIADDRQDKLYLFFFESPSEEWDSAWKTGDQILKKLMVDFPEE